MISKKIALAALAAVATAFAASSTQAATVLKSGDNVGGWTITFPVGIALVSDGGSTLHLEKGAAFTSGEGLSITFVQTSAAASKTITIVNESVTNVSGTPFTGFQFLLLNTLPGSAAPAAFTGEVFKPAPFSTTTKTSDDITFSGGTLADGSTAKWGFGSDGDLVINANPTSSGIGKVFDFKEQPNTGGNLIPVPAAAWTGLTGLAGLGAIASAKRVRRILA